MIRAAAIAHRWFNTFPAKVSDRGVSLEAMSRAVDYSGAKPAKKQSVKKMTGVLKKKYLNEVQK